MKDKQKTVAIHLTEGQLLSLLYLAQIGADPHGDPFKDWYEMNRRDIRPYEEIRGAFQKLNEATKAFEDDD